ncbi:hypothetical protein TcWFU_003804 [Taenia crassiceps]|uniref:Uncharacterized protein n=1 Tax=Taenia crassiceps TaxID=6207 RepID=A0ABR4QQ53_9CEST
MPPGAPACLWTSSVATDIDIIGSLVSISLASLRPSPVGSVSLSHSQLVRRGLFRVDGWLFVHPLEYCVLAE